MDEGKVSLHSPTLDWLLSLPFPQAQAAKSSPRFRRIFVRDAEAPLGGPRTPFNDGYTLTRLSGGKAAVARSWIPNSARPSLFSWRSGSVHWDSRLAWLCLYFSFNLLLTLSNKSVLTAFPFPYTLTAIHALCSTLGGLCLRVRGAYSPKRLDFRNELVLAAFSFLYSTNIAVSNVSLHLVTVPFHQVVRAITPLFTIALSFVLFNGGIRSDRVYALFPVICGVALATYGDYYFTMSGLFLTLLGTLLAALKTIYTSVLQSPSKCQTSLPATPSIPAPATSRHRPASPSTLSVPRSSWDVYIRRFLVPSRLELHPLDLLARMSPLAFVQCVLYAQLSGELDRLSRFGTNYNSSTVTHNSTVPITAGAGHSGIHALSDCLQLHGLGGISFLQAVILLVNGFIAFGLNVVSFSANGKVGALSMTVAANVKQVLTILISVSLFNLHITTTNALGITITLLGGAWYAWVEYGAKVPRQKIHL